MNASKFLISTAAAAAVVGVIGLSYAQTTTEASPSAPQVPISETQPYGQPAGPGLTPTPAPATAVQTAPAQTTGPAATTPQATTPTMPSHPALAADQGNNAATPRSGPSDSPNASTALPMDGAVPPVERAPQADRN
jgi:hypothetical protein